MTEYTITKLRSLLEADSRIARLLTKVRGVHGDAHDLIRLYQLATRAGKRVYWEMENADGSIMMYRADRLIEIFDNVNAVLERNPDLKWYPFNVKGPLEDEPVFRFRPDDNTHGVIRAVEMYGYNELHSSGTQTFHVQ